MPVLVSNLGAIMLGLEADGVITINQTADGYHWHVMRAAGRMRRLAPRV